MAVIKLIELEPTNDTTSGGMTMFRCVLLTDEAPTVMPSSGIDVEGLSDDVALAPGSILFDLGDQCSWVLGTDGVTWHAGPTYGDGDTPSVAPPPKYGIHIDRYTFSTYEKTGCALLSIAKGAPFYSDGRFYNGIDPDAISALDGNDYVSVRKIKNPGDILLFFVELIGTHATLYIKASESTGADFECCMVGTSDEIPTDPDSLTWEQVLPDGSRQYRLSATNGKHPYVLLVRNVDGAGNGRTIQAKCSGGNAILHPLMLRLTE